MQFELSTHYTPSGDQPKAIQSLISGIKKGNRFQTLLGVTGSGKTFTIANVIQKIQKPTLVIAPNKTLAAQLVSEFRMFFPKNAVEYFVSYYDYYQPEAYISVTDTYIEKETQINEEIDRLRHSATAEVLSRKDVIVVASVSCIYGLGSPEFYRNSMIDISVGEKLNREDVLRRLVEMQYSRSEFLVRGAFRVRGEVIEVMLPSHETIVRVCFDGGIVREIVEYDFLTGDIISKRDRILFYPAKHFVVPDLVMNDALSGIEKELKERIGYFEKHRKFLEAERITHRTKQDIEMLREIGYCSGIENYSRYFTGRSPGDPPFTLVDYFGDDYLLVIDESHVSVPQISGMYHGDRARKQNLIEYGFRLPSALDNRPLRFSEFEDHIHNVIFTSATPAVYEKAHSENVVEQIIRPTGLIDPELIVRPTKDQVHDVMKEIVKVTKRGDRVLITTLTKKMAEDLSEYLKEDAIKAEYLHSGVDTLERIKILEDLRRGKIEVLVGVNLLREGLDLPEVSLVAILDADKEGFLRSETALIQTIGRSARNIRGRVLLYADKLTGSLKRAIDETNRRRKIQQKYNEDHNITPTTISKEISSIVDHEIAPKIPNDTLVFSSQKELLRHISQKEKEMKESARRMEFEKAMLLRDEIVELRKLAKKF
ncbi:MAG: excinuclease ABC subunit UvrB [Candidatus Moraniibacteriota bacterium]|nr:MAG: excinuclease ABC subunit UvrB [Candidatus Moranbacteria bacterium]